MANLLVRNIEDEVVEALKTRSGKHGVSAEEEHRRILRSVLLGPKAKTFVEVLMSIPNAGQDSDFEREQGEKSKNVFD